MKSARWFVSYIVVACIGLGLAFVLSLRFIAPAHSQDTNLEAPSSGELPPEFLNEVSKTQAPTTQAPLPAEPPAKTGTGTIVEDSAIDAPSLGAELYVYDPTGRRDPFKSFRSGFKALDKFTALDPLQKWDLERLQVVGILWEVSSPRAMLRDPDGNVYTIVKNSKVGRNSGFVAAIREGEVVVIETFENEGTISKEAKVLEFGK